MTTNFNQTLLNWRLHQSQMLIKGTMTLTLTLRNEVAS